MPLTSTTLQLLITPLDGRPELDPPPAALVGGRGCLHDDLDLAREASGSKRRHGTGSAILAAPQLSFVLKGREKGREGIL